jgi:hypothetical protein
VRTKPRLEILRGNEPTLPKHLTRTAPVKSGVTIVSGQVISLEWQAGVEEYHWVLGGAAGAIPHIAVQDSVDFDVLEAGGLTGLSCLGPFEVQTAFYKSAETYNQDTLLTYDSTTGDVKPTTAGSEAPIIGVITHLRGVKNIADENSSVLPANANVITWATHYEQNLT